MLNEVSKLGLTEVVKVLVDAGADVPEYEDALRWASYNGHTKVVKVLLEADAAVHVWCGFALRGASKYGHIEVVNLLEEHMGYKNEV